MSYLLLGHEDLRQDERVMQLFGLVNTLLQIDPETFKRHLSIRRYAVIPLSPNSGLIGWVPHTDTLHTLIRDYRESKKILLNIEHRLMLQMAPDYDNLTLLQKVEVFEYALENTTGQDLYRVLWLKSRNSEVSLFGIDYEDSTNLSMYSPGLRGVPIIHDLWRSCRWWAIFSDWAIDIPRILCWSVIPARWCISILVIVSRQVHQWRISRKESLIT